METFARDLYYLVTKLGLKLETKFVERRGPTGHVDSNRTLDFVKSVNLKIRRRLFDIYKYDFLIFGYDWKKYFN